MTQRIFFAHANGFPSATYRKLFQALGPEYEVSHLDRHGHDPRFPVDDNWQNLVQELSEQLKRLHPETKVLYPSGYADDMMANYGFSGQASEFVQKPFTPATLAQKVREVLEK